MRHHFTALGRTQLVRVAAKPDLTARRRHPPRHHRRILIQQVRRDEPAPLALGQAPCQARDCNPCHGLARKDRHRAALVAVQRMHRGESRFVLPGCRVDQHRTLQFDLRRRMLDDLELQWLVVHASPFRRCFQSPLVSLSINPSMRRTAWHHLFMSSAHAAKSSVRSIDTILLPHSSKYSPLSDTICS